MSDTYGPAVTVTLPDGSTATSRAHTHTVYDQGAPAIPSGLGITAWRLPTTVTTSGYLIDGLTDPTALTGGVDTDTRTTTNGYAPIDGASATGPTSGWVLGQPTTVTVSGATARTLFDTAGRVLQQRQPASSGTDQGTRVTTYYTTAANATLPGCGSHPQWDGLVCQTQQAGTGAALPVQTGTGYSMLLAPTTVTDTSGAVTRTSTTGYDTAGRVTSVALSETGGADTAVPTRTYGYSATTGLPTTVTTTAGTVTTGYDALGRVTSQTDGTGANTANTTYDIDSRPHTVTDAKGTTSYTYDSASEHRGLLTGLDVGLGGGVPSAYTNLVHDADGNLTSFTYPNGVRQDDTLDPSGQLVARTVADSAGTSIAAWTRDYTVHGQVADETGPAANGSRTLTYGYDPAGRLTGATDAIGAGCTIRQYAFTADSDRTGLTTWTGLGDGTCPATTGTPASTRTGTFNTYDQLTATAVTGVGAGSGTYGYDALGRVTTLPAIDSPGTDTSHNITLGYFTNDLPASQAQNGTTRTYHLDALNRLGSWVDATGTTSTTTLNHYDDTSDSPSWTDLGTGTWTRQTTTPAGLLGIIATGATGTGTATSATVQILNPHGDVYTTIPDTTAITAAAVGPAHDTDEYGNTLTTSGPVYGWVGGHQRITDTTTGLIQMGVRLYNASTGMFLGVDPVYGGNSTPYAYPVDPIRQFDTSGRWDLGSIIAVVAVVALVVDCLICDVVVGVYTAIDMTRKIRSGDGWGAAEDALGIFGIPGLRFAGRALRSAEREEGAAARALRNVQRKASRGRAKNLAAVQGRSEVAIRMTRNWRFGVASGRATAGALVMHSWARDSGRV